MKYIKRSWREQIVLLKWKYPDLCDEDFVYREGQKERMLLNLCAKLKMTRAELDMLFIELQTY